MLQSNVRMIKHEAGPPNIADEFGNIDKACKMMSVSETPSTATKMPWMNVAWMHF